MAKINEENVRTVGSLGDVVGYSASVGGPPASFPCGPDAAKEIRMRRLGFVITIAAVLAAATPALAQQQPAPAPPDQGNGNWDPPPVTKPTTQR